MSVNFKGEKKIVSWENCWDMVNVVFRNQSITLKIYPFASLTLYLILLPVNSAHTHIGVASLCLTHISSLAPMEHHLVATVNLSFLPPKFLSNCSGSLSLQHHHPTKSAIISSWPMEIFSYMVRSHPLPPNHLHTAPRLAVSTHRSDYVNND